MLPFRHAALILLTLGLPVRAAAACAARTHISDLQRPINEAQAAFASMDSGGFDRASLAGATALGCLAEPISTTMAAAWHRHEGLSAYLTDDLARARSAFRAARTLQPAWSLPEDIAPPGNPLALLYDEASALGPGPEEPVWVQPGLTLLVDGAISTSLPAERPAIVQVLAADGQVLHTDYVRVGAPLPADLNAGPLPPLVGGTYKAPPPAPEAQRLRRKDTDVRDTPTGLVVGAAGSLALSGVALGLSAVSHSRYLDPTTPEDRLDGLVTRNHAQVLAAGGLAAVGLGLGITVVVW